MGRKLPKPRCWSAEGSLVSSLLAVFLIVSPCSISADTHYVSNTGTNVFPYTSWATSTDSLRAAIEAADLWDTIRVAAGSYTCDSLLLKKGQVFIGSGMDSTYVQHNGTYFGLLVIADSSVTRGFHFDGIVDTGLAGNLTYRVGDAIGAYTDVNALFTNNRVTNVKGTFLLLFNSVNFPENRMHIDSCEIRAFEQAVDAVGTSTRVTNNVFYLQDSNQASMFRQVGKNAEIWDNRFIKTVERSGSAILDLSPIDTVLIRNNLFVSDSISRGAAIWLNRTDPARVAVGELYNNTVIRGEFGIFTTGNSANPADATVHNNLFAHILRSDYAPRLTGDTLVQYNAFWQTNANGTPHDTADFIARNNIFTNPMFADTIEFLLQAFSPAIDAGDPTIMDVDGSRSDIGYAGGPSGFTYSYEDLPPQAPSSLGAQIVAGIVQLTWAANTEQDFASYRIYRDTIPIQNPTVALLLASVSPDTTYDDSSAAPGGVYYYRLSAVDAQSNEGTLSEELFVAISGINDDPIRPVGIDFGHGYPNPFNASLQIPVLIPDDGRRSGAYVLVKVYSVSGRLVRTLYQGVLARGKHTLRWDGTEPTGASSPSGVYFIRAIAEGVTHTQKVTLLK